MTKANIEKLESLVKEIMSILEEDKHRGLTIAITKNLVSIWSDSKVPKKKKVDLFSSDRGETWSDMRLL